MALRDVPAVDLDAFLVLLCRHMLSTYAKQSLLYHVQVRFSSMPVVSVHLVPNFMQRLHSLILRDQHGVRVLFIFTLRASNHSLSLSGSSMLC